MQYFRIFSRKSLGVGKATIDQAYSQFKDDELTPYLSEVPSQILRNASVQVKIRERLTSQGAGADNLDPHLNRRLQVGNAVVIVQIAP